MNVHTVGQASVEIKTHHSVNNLESAFRIFVVIAVLGFMFYLGAKS